jgi:hypothetical protein
MCKALLAALAMLVAAVVGCSEDEEETVAASPGSNTPCRNDPTGCPAGETCWIDAGRTDFVCQTSGSGVVGSPCVNSVGQPTCGDGLGCYHLEGATEGVCAAFCDPVEQSLQCADEAPCRPVLYELSSTDVVFQLCEPEGFGGQGGAGEGGQTGSGGAGGAA